MSEPKVKSILEIIPADLVEARTMFEVKPNVNNICWMDKITVVSRTINRYYENDSGF